MPGMTELSTVEWQSAQVTPSRVMWLFESTVAWMAHDRVHLEQRDRRRRALEIDLFEDPGGQHVGVHLEPDLERGRRVHALLDDLVQTERVGPELLVTEGVEAEDASGRRRRDQMTRRPRMTFCPFRIRQVQLRLSVRAGPMWP